MTPKSYLIATSIGGGAVPAHFIALSQELQRRGHKVAILTNASETEAQAIEGKARIYVWPSPRPVTLRDARFLLSVMSRHKPDCAIANFGAVNVFALAHWLRRVPVRIVWYHTLSTQIDLDSCQPRWRTRLLRLRKSFFYSLATHIFTNSQAASQDVQRTFGVPAPKCSVQTLSLADPLTNLAHQGSVNGPCKITCVGRFSPSKGQDTLIHALAKLKSGINWRAVMIGDGPNRLAVEGLAADLGVANRCTFIGNRPHQTALEEMATAAISVVPSRVEAFGFVGLESMAVGLPVIASKTGGLAEVIRDQIDGFLVPPGDAKGFSDKLELLLGDSCLRKRMGANGRKRFLSDFEQSRVIPQQVDWIERAACAA
jgi:glycosyltransferase involved in cell wall biosynthesis